MRTHDACVTHTEHEPNWRILLVLFTGACLLTSLGRYYAMHFGELLTTMLLLPSACVFAGIILLNPSIRRQPEFWLLLSLFLLTFLVSALNEKFYGVFTENRSFLGTLLVSIFACFSLFALLPQAFRQRVLRAFIGVSAAIVSVVCLWGLLLASTGTYYMPRFHPEYGIGLCPTGVGMGADFRLVTFTHPNTVGMVCEIVLLVSAYRILTAGNRVVKLLYGASACIAFLSIAAASSRTSSLAACAGLALIAFRLLYLRLADRKAWLRWGVSMVVAVATLAFCFVLLDQLYDIMLSLSPAGRSEMAAITDAERVVADETSAFSGRTNIWAGVLRCMTETPRLFLLGASPVHVGQVIAPYTPIWVQEVHSSFVQMLISCGVLCPALFVAFVIRVAVRGARLYLCKTAGVEADAAWLVPALVAILISASMETFLLLYQNLHFANLWFFLLAGYVVTADIELARARQG